MTTSALGSSSGLPWQAATTSELLSFGGSSSVAADEIEALGQSYDDEISSLESQLASAQGSSSGSDLAQLLAPASSSGTSFDEQFLNDLLPTQTYSSAGMLLADSGLFSTSQLDLLA